jgi:hypothetical protein
MRGSVMAEAVPAAAGGGGRPAYKGVSWAIAHTGLGRRTVQRRVDAWRDGDRGPYALRSSARSNPRNDRLVDPVDAERVRLQEAGRLDPSVTAEQWDAKIQERDVPWLYVTREPWFQELLGAPPPS